MIFEAVAYKSGMTDSDMTSYDADNSGGMAPMTASSPSQTIVFSVWDGDWAILEEYTTGNVRVESYVQGYHGLVKTMVSNIYYYQDELGSTSQIASASGALLEYYKYDLYGKPQFFDANNNQLSTTNYGVRDLFSGQRYIPEIGLYDDRNRFMSPDLGRFLQPDPIGFKGDGSNLYRYCGNDWANRSDPMGLIQGVAADLANLQNNQQDQHMMDPINMQRIQIFKQPDASSAEVPPAEAAKGTQGVTPGTQGVTPEQKYTAAVLGQNVGVTITAGPTDQRTGVRDRLDAAFDNINQHGDKLSADDVKVIHNVKSVTVDDKLRTGINMQTGTYNLRSAYIQNSSSAAWLASTIGHDAYHVTQYQRGEVYNRETSGRLEHEANIFQMRVGRIFGLTERQLQYLNSDTHTLYNTAPY